MTIRKIIATGLLSLALLAGCGEEKAPATPATPAAEAPVNPETVHVEGYTREDGTQVEAYDRTAPNDSAADNRNISRPSP